jgi:hypothetical protein
VEEPKQPVAARQPALKPTKEEEEEEARLVKVPGAVDLSNYERGLKMSWVWQELERVRNIRPGFGWVGRAERSISPGLGREAHGRAGPAWAFCVRKG